MPIQTQRIQFPAPLGGVLDESSTPRKVGDNGGCVSANNLIYRRAGAWGVRPGSQAAYVGASAVAGVGNPFVPYTATRWYCSLPSILTQTVLAAGGALYAGADPNTTTPTNLPKIATFNSLNATPISFTSAYDPAYNSNTGSDVLIITGATSNNGFAKLQLLIAPLVAPGDTLTVTWGGTGSGNAQYTILPTDSLASILSGLATAINLSTAVLGGAAFIAPVVPAPVAAGAVSGTITMYALSSGAGGNSITGEITSTNVSFLGSPRTPTAFAGGGSAFSGPLKYNGSVLGGLSGAITQPFTGCIAWHNHVWYWGDPANPGTLYASDINQPEGWSFMTNNGGYPIGKGDGDPIIQQCVAIGNILYVFKTNSIYAITGYDFQPGEYQFNVQPAIQGNGVPSYGCVATLRDALVYWNGTSFRRLSPGALETEDIGLPIALTEGALTNQLPAQGIQCAAGSFVATTRLGEPNANLGNFTLNNCAYFLFNIAIGSTRMVVYDDDASQFMGAYAWANWAPPTSVGSSAAGLFAFGNGLDSAGTARDVPQLYVIEHEQATALPKITQFGTNARTDDAVQVAFSVTSGWINGGSAALTKELHEVYLEVNATANVQFTMSVRPSTYTEASGIPSVYNPQTVALALTRTNPTLNDDTYQVLQGTLKPFLRANGFQFTIGWSGADPAQAEIMALVLDFIEQTFVP